MNAQTLPQEFEKHKAQWLEVGEKILHHYGQPKTPKGIGLCIDSWKSDKAIDEEEFLNAVGFLFGDLLIRQSGGKWVIVEDAFGRSVGIEKLSDRIFFPLDAISKRLRDDSDASREIPTLADFFAKNS